MPPVVPNPEVMAACQAAIGHTFQNPDLLATALTHSSARLEAGRSNERLEFLGDAVLGLLVSELLYAERPQFDEGGLTRARAELVSHKALAAVGRSLRLERYVMTGRMFATPQDIAESVLSNAVEAILAAIWIDGGMVSAKAFVLAHVWKILPPEAREDWKGRLARWVQAGNSPTMPRYELISFAGDDHCRTFEVAVILDKRRHPSGFGRSKKEAEQRAARQAVKVLGIP